MPRFVVVTGLPASGKSTIGRQLFSAMALPLLDKDEILEQLFDQHGVGDGAHRSALSRAADREMETRAMSLPCAVLVSWWRHPRTLVESGTPTQWLASLSAPCVELHCRCDPEVAVDRFFARARHPGHLDALKDRHQELARFRELASLGPLGLPAHIEIDAGQSVDIERVMGELARA